jgi:hypothetical protein
MRRLAGLRKGWTQVANSDKSRTGAITGVTGAVVVVTCDAKYGGGGAVTCHEDGEFDHVRCFVDSTEDHRINFGPAAAGEEGYELQDSGATLASANGFLGPKYGWASDVASSAVQRPSSTGSTALLDSFILVQGVEWQMELPVRCAHSHSATPSRNKYAG